MLTPCHRSARPHRRLLTIALLALLAIGWSPSLRAQQPNGIRGTVRDSTTGGAIRGALITVAGTPRSATTDSAGVFVIGNLPPGTYDLRVTALGYTVGFRSGVGVSVSDTTSVEITLQAAGAFVPLPPEDTLATDSLRLPVPDSAIVRYRQIELRMSELPLTPGTRTQMALFDDVDLMVELREVSQISPTAFRWTGTVVDSAGSRRGTVILLVHDGHLTGNIRIGPQLYQIRPQRPGTAHVVVEVNPLVFGPPDTLPLRWQGPPIRERPLRPEPHVPARLALPAGAAPGSCTDHLILTAGPIPEVRLLVLYSDAAASAVYFPEDEIQLALVETNLAFDDSHIRLRVTPAHFEQVSVVDNGSIGTTVYVQQLLDPTDGILDGVHSLRDAYYADIVVLVVENSSGGAGYTLDHVSATFAPMAFAVVGRASTNVDFTLSHELGHIMGARHQRAGSPPPAEPYTYNFGFAHVPEWRTIMAVGAANGMPINLFSNPDVAYDGTPTGIASTDPMAADNHRALANTAAVVASFRMTPVWFVSAGGASPWLERNVDDFPLADLGFGDFNGDGQADVLRADGTGTWWVSFSGANPWTSLNTQTGNPVTDLAFGDFDGDGKTDAFRTDPIGGAWFVAWSGQGAWQPLQPPDPLLFNQPLTELAFADFDGDGKTDVFRADPTAGSWFVSSGGQTSWTLFDPGAMPNPGKFGQSLNELAFGDFNGNGAIEALRINPNPGLWFAYEAGDGNWRMINGPDATLGVALDGLAFGDFDGDGTTDVFHADASHDRWLVSWSGVTPWEVQNTSCFDRSVLRFADFDGDGTTDVFRTGIRP